MTVFGSTVRVCGLVSLAGGAHSSLAHVGAAFRTLAQGKAGVWLQAVRLAVSVARATSGSGANGMQVGRAVGMQREQIR